MRCPHCGCRDNHVVDTRSTGQGQAVRRRRECKECAGRFTTYEYIQERPLRVLKSRGDTEDFERAKLVSSIQVACAKRPVSPSTIDAIAGNIQYTLTVEGGGEVRSSRLGEMVMEALKPLDRVAYVRFASVYRNFQDIQEFQEMIADLNLRRERSIRARDQVELPI